MLKDKIDIVFVSSNDDPSYSDFWPMIRDRWIELNVKPVCIRVSHKWETDYIDDHENYAFLNLKIPSDKKMQSGKLSALSRLYGVKWFPRQTCMLSDIDLYPLDENYYNKITNELTYNNVVSSNYMPYGGNKHKGVREFRICHILSNTDLLGNLFEVNREESFYKYATNVVIKSTNKLYTATDELYFTKRFYETRDFIKFNILDHRKGSEFAELMIARIKDKNGKEACPHLDEIKEKLINNNSYVCTSFHMPRPYQKHKKDILKIINLLKLNQ